MVLLLTRKIKKLSCSFISGISAFCLFVYLFIYGYLFVINFDIYVKVSVIMMRIIICLCCVDTVHSILYFGNNKVLR